MSSLPPKPRSEFHGTGVLSVILKEGDRVTKPQPGDIVTVEYMGFYYDREQHDNLFRDKQFATGSFTGVIGMAEFSIEGLHSPTDSDTGLDPSIFTGDELANPPFYAWFRLGNHYLKNDSCDRAYGEMQDPDSS
ncbi:MAG: hypothetical protein M1840_006979 [Geoglossum simile]|nr:MAG: hypothetical protein M1840_006979 [Geoglossum simile]